MFEHRRGAVGKLGGFFKGSTDIPVHVIDDVCTVVGNSRYRFANNLPGYRQKKTKPVDKILESWIDDLGDEATLDKLFEAMHLAKLFYDLEKHITERLEDAT